MRDNSPKTMSLASLPVEILQIITSFLSDQDVAITLPNCGDRTLERKLKNGGVTYVRITSSVARGKTLKVLREYSSLSEVHIETWTANVADLASILNCLPQSLRRLRLGAFRTLEWVKSSSKSKITRTRPFGDYDAPTPCISERFPLLTHLDLEPCNGGNDWYGQHFKLLFESLPPSLTHLSAPDSSKMESYLIKHIPPQLEVLLHPGIELTTEFEPFEPLPSLRSIHISNGGNRRSFDRSRFGRRGASSPETEVKPVELSIGFPNLQTLCLVTDKLSNYNLITMRHLRSLDLSASSSSMSTLFATFPPTLTALAFDIQKMSMRASDATLPRLLSLSSLDLKRTKFDLEDECDPLSILLEICPNVTHLSAKRTHDDEGLPIMRTTTQGLNPQLQSVKLSFADSAQTFATLANFPQLTSVTALSQYAHDKHKFEFWSRGMATSGLEHTYYPTYLKDVTSKLPSRVSTLNIEDLRLSDEEIKQFCEALSDCKSDPSTPLPCVPYDWKFAQTDSLCLEWGKFHLEPQLVANSSHPFASVVLHPILEPRSSSRLQASIPHVPTILALLPRTLTALDTCFDLTANDEALSLLFSPTAFPSLKSLRTSTLLPNMQQWTNLESLKLLKIFRDVSIPRRAPSSEITPGISPMRPGQKWVDLLPPNLTHLKMPQAETPMDFHHLSRLTSLNLPHAASWPVTHLPSTITYIKSQFSTPEILQYAAGLPLLKVLNISDTSIYDTTLDAFYKANGSRIQLVGGMLRKVNIEKILQRVPLPPPAMLNGDASEYLGQLALACYPQWKTDIKPFWQAQLDFSVLPIATWNLFASWFSPNVTSFDFSKCILPKEFGAAMPSNTLEIIARKETTFIREEYHDDEGYDSDDNDFDYNGRNNDEDDGNFCYTHDEDDGDGNAKTWIADDDSVHSRSSSDDNLFQQAIVGRNQRAPASNPLCKRLMDLSLLPASLKTLSIKYHYIERPSELLKLSSLTKLIVKCSTNTDFEALIKASLPSSLTQLNIYALSTPNMEVLTHLPPHVTRLSILHQSSMPLGFLLDRLPTSVHYLRLHRVNTVGLAATLARCIEQRPNLTLSLTSHLDDEDN